MSLELSEDTIKQLVSDLERIVRSQCAEIAELHEDVARLNRVVSFLIADDEDGTKPIHDALALWAKHPK